MTFRFSSSVAWASLVLVSLSLAGCASAPKSGAPTAATAPAAAQPARGYGEMAPVPNPVEDPAAKAKPVTPTTRARSATRAPVAAPPTRPPAPQRANADAQRAAQLRVSGLEQLNRGAVDRAVNLLQQARRLDPDNSLIQRDLDRALRVSRALLTK